PPHRPEGDGLPALARPLAELAQRRLLVPGGPGRRVASRARGRLGHASRVARRRGRRGSDRPPPPDVRLPHALLRPGAPSDREPPPRRREHQGGPLSLSPDGRAARRGGVAADRVVGGAKGTRQAVSAVIALVLVA